MTPDMQQLRALLDAHAQGRDGAIVPTKSLCDALAACWPLLAGARDTGMHPGKLRPDRLEEVKWRSPKLTFLMERHGGTVRGSTRAEVYAYTVDLDQRGVSSDKRPGWRQLRPARARLDTQSMADEVVASVIAGSKDRRLKWFPDQQRVRILINELIPKGSASNETVAGRRKRLSKQLEEGLREHGWNRVPRTAAHTYERGKTT